MYSNMHDDEKHPMWKNDKTAKLEKCVTVWLQNKRIVEKVCEFDFRLFFSSCTNSHSQIRQCDWGIKYEYLKHCIFIRSYQFILHSTNQNGSNVFYIASYHILSVKLLTDLWNDAIHPHNTIYNLNIRYVK